MCKAGCGCCTSGFGRLAALIDDVESWVKALDWSTRRIEKPMEDSQIGRYKAPSLLMQEGTDRVLLEPVARSAPGAEGVVDLYLMPAYDDIASLTFADGPLDAVLPLLRYRQRKTARGPGEGRSPGKHSRKSLLR